MKVFLIGLWFALLCVAIYGEADRAKCEWPRGTVRIATLTTNVNPEGQVLNLTSTTCIQPTRQDRFGLYVDREFMEVVRVEPGIVVVRRGQAKTSQTKHIAGSVVFYGPMPTMGTIRPSPDTSLSLGMK